jgi:hypothetical protein
LSVKGILASYRWRRRFVWLTATAAVVGGGTAIALTAPNTRPKQRGPSNVTVKVDTSPAPVRLGPHDEALALAVASRFLHTAVARKNIDRSWNLVSVGFRAGFTREQWDRGDMPVVPYPVRKARWNLDYSDTEGIGFSLALSPAKGSHQGPQDFQIGLHPVGSANNRRWLVDYWQPVATGGAVAAGGGGGGGGGNVTGSASGKAKESMVWLLVPVGLLSLIVLLPLGIVTVNWYRGRRAQRALMRS